MPALQREACRQCVCCGVVADQFCARCGVTPYCSTRCQRNDWNDRHKAVCHNLARLLSQGTDVKDAPDLTSIAPAPPLRRPHSPALAHTPRNDDAGSDRSNKNYRQGDRNVPNNRSNQKGGVVLNRFQEGRSKTKDDNEGNKNQTPQKHFPRHDTPKHKPKDGLVPKFRSPKPATEVKEYTPTPVKEEAKPAVKVVNPTPVVKQEVKETVPVKSVPKVVPKTYLVEHLSVGDVVLLSVDRKAAECRTSRPGFVCLSMHEKFEADYQKLCEDYVVDCEADTTELLSQGSNPPRSIRRWLEALKEDKLKGPTSTQKLQSSAESLTPGVSISYLDPEDGGWYRARCLNSTTIALLDSGKIVQLKPSDKLKNLPVKYQEIPEFCCLLDANVELGSNLTCTLTSQTPSGFKVILCSVESGSEVGGGEVARWSPEVEYPVQEPTAPAPKIPEVARPPLQAGTRVILTDAAGVRVCVRPAAEQSQRQFDAVLQDVVLYGTAASPLKEPPLQGQTVVAKFTDDLHYRALCRRTNVKQNKYQLEYIEYGNIEVSKLELLYPCPEDYQLEKVPTVASILKLDIDTTLTPDAEKYLECLKEQEMILTLPDGAKTAPSGTIASLTVVKTNEDVQKKLLELSKPEWKKIEERGGDVVDTPCMMYREMECLEMGEEGGVLQVLDSMLLDDGSISACQLNLAHAQYVFTHLADRMAEYCNSELGRQPYLPKPEELCIAKYPQNQKWYRAVFLEQVNGPGGDQARMLYVDTGHVALVPVSHLRKIVPEFVKGLPAVASHLDIKDFPSDPTPEMISKARQFMKMDEQGRGELRVSKCIKVDEGLYLVEAKDLLLAMTKK